MMTSPPAEAVDVPRFRGGLVLFPPVQHPTDEYHRPDAAREWKQHKENLFQRTGPIFCFHIFFPLLLSADCPSTIPISTCSVFQKCLNKA
jgi:hypothetical protein